MKNTWIVNIVRVLPILMSIYVVFLGSSILAGFYNPVFNNIFVGVLSLGGFVSQILFLLLSKTFKFCKIHQMIVLNLLGISVLRYLEANGITIKYEIYFWIIPATLLLILYAIIIFTNGGKR